MSAESRATKIAGRCNKCGTTLWSYREPYCGACGSTDLSDAEGERVVFIITQDEEGDYLVRDPSRNGLLCHAGTEVEAVTRAIQARADYDAAVAIQRAEASQETEAAR